MANFCRSPVAEAVFNTLDNNNFKAISAGIAPLKPIGMDARSEEFLVSKEIEPTVHNAQKINRAIIETSDVVFALDLIILNELNRKFKKYQNKFKLMNYKTPNLFINDPYKYDANQYHTVMSNIYTLIKNGLL